VNKQPDKDRTIAEDHCHLDPTSQIPGQTKAAVRQLCACVHTGKQYSQSIYSALFTQLA